MKVKVLQSSGQCLEYPGRSEPFPRAALFAAGPFPGTFAVELPTWASAAAAFPGFAAPAFLALGLEPAAPSARSALKSSPPFFFSFFFFFFSPSFPALPAVAIAKVSLGWCCVMKCQRLRRSAGSSSSSSAMSSRPTLARSARLPTSRNLDICRIMTLGFRFRRPASAMASSKVLGGPAASRSRAAFRSAAARSRRATSSSAITSARPRCTRSRRRPSSARNAREMSLGECRCT
mmetsp:Transcript_25234/g.56764  ORF Transcript_25234/g.56764 Transcript_25234/m.56764 type:complete len:234 (+) Transcript_25234:81-782(+)